MGKGKKQKEKKVVSLAEFNASMGLDPLKPLELQSLPTEPKGDASDSQRDFSKVRREGGRGFRRDEYNGDERRRPMDRGETNGFRDLDWSQARQAKLVQAEAEVGKKTMPTREVDFSSARQGTRVIGQEDIDSRRLDKKSGRDTDRDLSLFRRRETIDDDSLNQDKPEKDFANLRKKEPTSQVQTNSNTREVDFSSVRQGTSVIEVAADAVPPKKNRDLDFGDIRKNAKPITQPSSDKVQNSHIDFSKARSGSHVIASVPESKSRNTETGVNREDNPKDYKQVSKRTSGNRPQRDSRELDFSKLRIRE